jgi:hypothetical protein
MENEMKTYVYGMLLTCLLAASSAANAQEGSLLDYVVGACADDLERFCADVTPGEGHLVHCLAAYQDQISNRCGAALYDAASILQDLANAIAYVGTACSADIDRFCAETPIGEGRIIDCLGNNGDQLTEACSTALEETVGE